LLSDILKRNGVPHHVLNAKQHEREAQIIAQAGRKGSVTVSTNMAGRGTDILLGGNPEALTRDYCLKERLALPLGAASALVSADAQATTMVLFQIEGPTRFGTREQVHGSVLKMVQRVGGRAVD